MTCSKHVKQEDVNYCTMCGANLTLDQEEIDARDHLFPGFVKMIVSAQPSIKESEIHRAVLDDYLSRNAIGFTRKMMKADVEASEKKQKESREKEISEKILEIETEKLKVLKAIQKKLK